MIVNTVSIKSFPEKKLKYVSNWQAAAEYKSVMCNQDTSGHNFYSVISSRSTRSYHKQIWSLTLHTASEKAVSHTRVLVHNSVQVLHLKRQDSFACCRIMLRRGFMEDVASGVTWFFHLLFKQREIWNLILSKIVAATWQKAKMH